MIRVQMIRSDTRHPNRHRCHQGRACCEVASRRFEAEGPALIYKLTTLLWLHGHGGAAFEVWDDRSPTGKPGGLAMRGRVRNRARLVKGKPNFTRKAKPDTDFMPNEREVIGRAAGTVVGVVETPPPSGLSAAVCATHPSDGPEYPREGDRACTGVIGALTPEVA